MSQPPKSGVEKAISKGATSAKASGNVTPAFVTPRTDKSDVNMGFAESLAPAPTLESLEGHDGTVGKEKGAELAGAVVPNQIVQM